MIEFGMNDHIENTSVDGGEEAGSAEERAVSFTNTIENAVDTLQQNGIDVILIGFPQQNMTWDMEDMGATGFIMRLYLILQFGRMFILPMCMIFLKRSGK